MAVQYTTLGALQDRLGEAGVNLRLSDRPTAVQFAIDQASGWIEEFLFGRYGAGLTSSRWVANACASLALVPLCSRLGNPPPDGVLLEFDRLMGVNGRPGVLERMRLGQVNLPDAGALGDVAPAVTNYHVRNVPVPHVVAEPGRSTDGRTAKAPRRDWYDPLQGWPYG